MSQAPRIQAPRILTGPAPPAGTVYGPPVPGKPKTRTARRSYLNMVVTQVHGGLYNEQTGAMLLRKAGFPDSKNPFAQTHGRGRVIDAITAPFTPHRHGRFAAEDLARSQAGHPDAGVVVPGVGLLSQVAGPILQGLVNSPSGGTSVITHPVRTGQQIQHHIAHPGIADAAFLGYAGAVGVATAGVRGAAAAQALKSGAGARAAVTRAGAEGGSLLHTPVGEPVRIHIPHTRGTVFAPPNVARKYEVDPDTLATIGVEGGNPARIDTGGKFAANVARRGVINPIRVLFNPHMNKMWIEDGHSRLAAAQKAGLSKVPVEISVTDKPPRLKRMQDTVARFSENNPQSLFGITDRFIGERVPMVGPVGATTIERPVSRNVLIRPVNRARGKLIQRSVNEGARSPVTATGARFGGIVSARTTVARENRAARRVNLALANADAVALDKAVAKLSPAERNAISVASIAGEEALLDPAAAVGKQIAAHQHFAAVGRGGPNEADNLQRIQDLGAAQLELQNPSAKLKAALALTKKVAADTERQLIDAGLLDPAVAQQRLNNMADLYGYPQAPPGSFFMSQKPAYVTTGAKLPAFGGRPTVSAKGAPPPSMTTRIPGLRQRFTGESVARGYVAGPDTVARRAVLVSKALDAKQHYEDLWSIGSPVKQSSYDVPFRDSQQIRDDVRQFFDRLANTVHTGEDVGNVLSAAEIAKVAELLKPDPRSFGHVPVGGAQDGIRWVDRRYDVELQRAISGDELTGIVDLINNYARLTQLYLRPAYILNLPGNIVMNTISDGLRVPGAGRAAVKANVLYGPDVTRWMDAGMGTSLSRTYSIGTGKLGRLSDDAAEFWNGITDMYSRRFALVAEGARQGVRTPAQWQALKAAKPGSPLAAKRTMIFRVANKNIVDYSLTPFEANVARRWIYFYPWVSRGTLWALRTLIENPGKTFTLFQLGQVGAENAHKALGKNLPQWVEQFGPVPVSGGRGDTQKTLNLSSMWTYGTAGQAGAAITDTVKSLAGLPQSGNLANILTPAATLGVQATQKSDIGQTRSTGFPGLLQSLPEYQVARRLGVVGKPSATYPETGILPALMPFLVGGAWPRGISRGAIGEQAVTAAATPKAKLAIQLDQLAELGLTTPERATAAKAAIDKATPRDVAAARRQVGPLILVVNDIGMLVARGKLTEEQAASMRAGLLGASAKQMSEAHKQLEQELGR